MSRTTRAILAYGVDFGFANDATFQRIWKAFKSHPKVLKKLVDDGCDPEQMLDDEDQDHFLIIDRMRLVAEAFDLDLVDYGDTADIDTTGHILAIPSITRYADDGAIGRYPHKFFSDANIIVDQMKLMMILKDSGVNGSWSEGERELNWILTTVKGD